MVDSRVISTTRLLIAGCSVGAAIASSARSIVGATGSPSRMSCAAGSAICPSGGGIVLEEELGRLLVDSCTGDPFADGGGEELQLLIGELSQRFYQPCLRCDRRRGKQPSPLRRQLDQRPAR